MHSCFTGAKDKCIECYKLRNAIVGTKDNGWKCTLKTKRCSKKYRVEVLYYYQSKKIFKIYPLPKVFESCIFSETFYPESSSDSDYPDINFNEEDSDLLFDSIINAAEGQPPASEEEMTTIPSIKIRNHPPVSEDDKVTTLRLYPSIQWYYELDDYTIMNIKLVPWF